MKQREPEVVQVDAWDRRLKCDHCQKKNDRGYFTGLGTVPFQMGPTIAVIRLCPDCAIYWGKSLVETGESFRVKASKRKARA